jgi:hypothetical protein
MTRVRLFDKRTRFLAYNHAKQGAAPPAPPISASLFLPAILRIQYTERTPGKKSAKVGRAFLVH